MLVGSVVGMLLGSVVGISVGNIVGILVGNAVGEFVGAVHAGDAGPCGRLAERRGVFLGLCGQGQVRGVERAGSHGQG